MGFEGNYEDEDIGGDGFSLNTRIDLQSYLFNKMIRNICYKDQGMVKAVKVEHTHQRYGLT